MPPDGLFGDGFGRDPAVVAAFRYFFSAQPPEMRANILAFLHLCGPMELTKADFRLNRSGAMRLVLRAMSPDAAADPPD